ncbi:hypothetical protein LR48_Vigan468s004700, partial [Vigna angularis]
TELQGFYYDPEKNRYFPIKGPIPGSSSKPKNPTPKGPQTPSNQLQSGRSSCRKLRNRTLPKLLQARELEGRHVIYPHYCRCNFADEYEKIQASKPVVWRYRGTDKMGVCALKHLRVDVQTLQGQIETDVLLTGSINGSLSFSEVGGVGQYFDDGTKWIADCVRNFVKGKTFERDEVRKPVFRPNRAALLMPSRISCIRLGPKCSPQAENDGSVAGRVLYPFLVILQFTTLGSETSGGSVYTLGLVEPLNLGPGTSLGGASVDLETRMETWFLRCKSDVFAQQIINSGNVILCGLRNGAIVTADFREKRESLSDRLISHRIPYSSSIGGCKKEWLKIRLYDHRLLQRGAVQSYEGHVNSHTRIQLGVDPTERFVTSGGEDCKLRLWSLKSGELIFEEKFSDSIISTMCYKTYSSCKAEEGNQYKLDSSQGTEPQAVAELPYAHVTENT